jgi:pimeloyl-ACP methyl ester carboxylesterase
VSVEEKTVKFTMKAIGGAFEGKLAEDGKSIDGKWSQGPASLPLKLTPGEKVGPPKRPQEPKKPYPYRDEEVQYENVEGGVKIAGTLTSPQEGGPFPAVLLISGSGPQDRNEEIMGHKPFLVLADYLTRRGIAVLRVDDRGVGGSTGKVGVSTIEDHVGDALAGIEFLKSRKEIDAGKIGLVGHSEGGLVAPAAAVKSPDVAFIVLLAGTGVRGDQIVYSQGELIAKSAGASADAIAKNTDLQRKLFAVLKETQDDEQAATQMREVVKAWKEQLTDAERATFDKIEQLLDAQLKTFTNPWFRHFLAYDPKPVLEMVQCPVLAIVGELDLQVPPDENLPAIEAALKKAGNRDYTVKELPGLNHLFQAATTGSPLEYGQIEETFNPAALKVVGDWIAERTKAH